MTGPSFFAILWICLFVIGCVFIGPIVASEFGHADREAWLRHLAEHGDTRWADMPVGSVETWQPLVHAGLIVATRDDSGEWTFSITAKGRRALKRAGGDA